MAVYPAGAADRGGHLMYTSKVPENAISFALNAMSKAVHDLAHEKGWYDKPETEDQYVERACNNLHDEVSELHTAWRDNQLRAPCDKAAKMKAAGLQPLTCLEEELADIVIRALDNAQRLGVNIGKVVLAKHDFNATRKTRHGGKRS
jgi:NTP pyrophosphatase (non-canonical NTP hydrolase)